MVREIEGLELLQLASEARTLASQCVKASEHQLSKFKDLGAILCKVKDSGVLKGRGAFDKWANEEADVKKSWRHLCMVLHRDRELIPAVQEWAKANNLACSTASDIYKLIPKWKKTSDSPSQPQMTQKRSLDFTASQRTQIAAECQTRSNPDALPDERDRAELFLFRLAASKRILLDRLLKRLDIAVVGSWLGALMSCSQIEDINVVKEDQELPSGAENGALEFSGSPEGSLSARTSQRSEPEVRAYYPPLKDIKTQSRVGQKRCREGFEMIIKLHSEGVQIDLIAQRLQNIGLIANPARIAHILAKEAC